MAVKSDASLLVVDDDDGLRALVCAVLQQEGYQVLDTNSPVRAMEVLGENAGQVRLLITDIVMPEMSGVELAKWVRGARREVGVLYMSGYTERVPPSALTEGAFIAKPFTKQALTEKVRQALEAPRGGATILVADDDAQVRDLFRQILTAQGYRVLEADNGKHAMNLLSMEPVDLLITDLVMPDQEGLETIRTLRQMGLDLRIIAISGAVSDYLQVARLMGANAVVRKPVSPALLVDTVQDILAGESGAAR
ncbi:MAG: response regulator [Acidobacteria bacterium]|nr:response regulator [Acidobacteriota bacterium]